VPGERKQDTNDSDHAQVRQTTLARDQNIFTRSCTKPFQNLRTRTFFPRTRQIEDPSHGIHFLATNLPFFPGCFLEWNINNILLRAVMAKANLWLVFVLKGSSVETGGKGERVVRPTKPTSLRYTLRCFYQFAVGVSRQPATQPAANTELPQTGESRNSGGYLFAGVGQQLPSNVVA